jgi:hypothetical protein
VLCWTWALIAGWRAVQLDGQTRDWLVTGVAMGLAFLFKYSALYQIVCFGIFFALWPPARAQLRRPGPWLALGIFLVCMLPVMIWNSQHGWITVNHVAANAGLHSQWKWPWKFIGDFWGGEIGLLNPVFFAGAIWASFAFWKRRHAQPLMLYLFCMSWPVFWGHALYAFHSRILPNWIAPAVPAMFLLMAIYWNERLQEGSRLAKPFLAAGLALGFFMTALMYDPDLIGRLAGEPLPAAADVTHRVRAWKMTAQLVEDERQKLEAQGQPAFIIGDDYGITGECIFYSAPARKAATLKWPMVYCVDSDTPANQFYFWPEYDYRATRKGDNAIYVVNTGPAKSAPGWLGDWLQHKPVPLMPPTAMAPPARIVGEFETVKDLGNRDVLYKGAVFHRIHLWACYHLK